MHRSIFTLTAALLIFPLIAVAEDRRPWESFPLQSWLTAHAFEQGHPSTGETQSSLDAIARFYRMVGHRNVWIDANGLRPEGEILWEALQNAPADGLAKEALLLAPLENLINDAGAFKTQFDWIDLPPSMQMDLALTTVLLRYASHLVRGRTTPQALDSEWITDQPPPQRNLPAELAVAVNTGRLAQYLKGLAPRQPGYQRLKQALRRYETIRDRGGWLPIAPGPSLRRGDRDPRIRLLRSRLTVSGDLADRPSQADDAFDPGLEAATMRFQHRHGLVPDGVVGKLTRAALNVTVEERIRQLQLNMERWRWYPHRFGDRYVWVNIPDFSLTVMEGNWAMQRMRAIVGRFERQTPSLSGRMTYLEFNPYWNVPGKIARKDLLPKIMNDPAYLIRQGFKVFDSWESDAVALNPEGIAWDQVSETHFPYRLRQEPSALNALGQVKFMFPNKQSVYIHDTPGKSLFRRSQRDFSSGCVRVESPLELARNLLRGQRWDRSRLEDTLHSGKQRIVVLNDPMPVHLVYFTAWVDEAGTIHFRADVYGRDTDLARAIDPPSPPSLLCDRLPTVGHLLAACAPSKQLASAHP